MPSEQQIVMSNYPIWTIGVTKDFISRRREHGNPDIWHEWKVYTDAAAKNIVRYFVSKDMKVGMGAGGYADYVYIFR